MLAGSLYWAWLTLHHLMQIVADENFSFLLSLLGMMVLLVMIARKSIALVMFLLLVLASIDRLILTEAHIFLNSFIGWTCLILAVVMSVGMLSENVDWAKKYFPTILFALLGVIFLAPVAIIGNILRMLRILPESFDK